jgi:pimeloyl-ACP methyl ester carboxylesterase
MLAFDRLGDGPPLALLHGTNGSRAVWAPVAAALAAARTVLVPDLPGHGASPATSSTPAAWAREVVALLDALGFGDAVVAGHSAGGWTALEVAKLGRATGVLALAPAGLWRRRSPWRTDLGLLVNWHLGQRLGTAVERPLRRRGGRRLALAQVSARPADVPVQHAVAAARASLAARGFPEHFRQTRRQRFVGGAGIDVPVLVVWGASDHVAPARTSRYADELPARAEVETWDGCGHMVMWDAPARLVAAALALPAARADQARGA